MNTMKAEILRRGLSISPQWNNTNWAAYALVSLDADLYGPTLEGLRYFYSRLSHGGIILLHDYHNTRFCGVRAAADAYENETGRLLMLPVADLHGSVMIVKP